MQVGKKVVCVNDAFSPDIKAIYKQLPKKDETYTVREVSLGREKIFNKDNSVTVRILLQELRNSVDPFHADKQELGFNAERFREVEEVSATEYSEASATGTLVNV
jgi:hypothetical protein